MIEPWQVPLLVMGVLAVATAGVVAVERLRQGSEDRPNGNAGSPRRDDIRLARRFSIVRDYAKTSSLAIPTVLLGIVAFGFFGPETIDTLTQVVTAATAIIAAAATERTYRDERDRRRDEKARRAQAQNRGGPENADPSARAGDQDTGTSDREPAERDRE